MRTKSRVEQDCGVGAPGTSGGLVNALVPTAYVTMAVLSRIGAEQELSLTLIRVLGILWDRRLRMTELAKYLGLEKQTVSGLVARAEQRGLVARAPNVNDGRAIDVFLTSAGADLVERLHVETQQALAPLTGQLSGPDQQLLQALLERMLNGRPE